MLDHRGANIVKREIVDANLAQTLGTFVTIVSVQLNDGAGRAACDERPLCVR
jgi:hypothetical protein